MKLKYFSELDGIRGLAALMVMWFHFFNRVHSENNILAFVVKTAIIGQTGVILFFVLSGFLITRILLSTKSHTRYFSNFYIKRSLRIFPLYYMAVGVYILSLHLFDENNVSGTSSTWYFWPYFQNIAMTFKWNITGPLHLWSLAVEEHFYLFWPLVIYYTSEKYLPHVIWSMIICAILLRTILYYNGFEVFYFTGTTIDALAIGALLALREIKQNFSIRVSRNQIILLCASGLAALVLWQVSGGKGLLLVQAFKGTFIAIFYYGLLLATMSISKKNILYKLLNQSLLQYTGKISYGLYVYHVLCFFLYFKYIETYSIILDFLICFALSYLVASASYHLFEAKFLRLKHRFTRVSREL